jgi:hypothetical protein
VEDEEIEKLLASSLKKKSDNITLVSYYYNEGFYPKEK